MPYHDIVLSTVWQIYSIDYAAAAAAVAVSQMTWEADVKSGALRGGAPPICLLKGFEALTSAGQNARIQALVENRCNGDVGAHYKHV